MAALTGITYTLPPRADGKLYAGDFMRMKVTNLISTQVSLEWTNVSNPTFTSYTLERSTDGITYAVHDSGIGTNTYVDMTVVIANTYFYRAKWVGSGGDSEYSTPVTIIVPGQFNVFPISSGGLFDEVVGITNTSATYIATVANDLGATWTFFDGGHFSYVAATPPVGGIVSITYTIFDYDGIGGTLIDTVPVTVEPVPALSYISSSEAIFTLANAAAPNEPVGAEDGDLIFMVATLETEAAGNWVFPNDFTELDDLNPAFGTTAGEAHHVGLAYKLRGPTQGNGYNVSTTGEASKIGVSAHCYRGANLTTPLDPTYVNATYFNQTDNDGALTAARPVTTAFSNQLVVLIQHYNFQNGTGAEPPVGYTMDYVVNGFNAAVCVASKFKAVAGLETPGGWQHNGGAGIGGGAVDSCNFTLAVRSA